MYAGLSFIAHGELEKGITTLQKSDSLAGSNLDPLALLGYAYGKAGKTKKALEIKKRLIDASKFRYIPSIYFAWIKHRTGRL